MRLHWLTSLSSRSDLSTVTFWLQGRGQFLSSRQVEVNGQVLDFAAAVVATGGAAAVPPVPGLADCGSVIRQ